MYLPKMLNRRWLGNLAISRTMTVHVESVLRCPAEKVWNEVQRSALLLEVIRPLVKLVPVDAPRRAIAARLRDLGREVLVAAPVIWSAPHSSLTGPAASPRRDLIK